MLKMTMDFRKKRWKSKKFDNVGIKELSHY